ncbi:MAG: hypothetical protein V1652_01960 [bacterium]
MRYKISTICIMFLLMMTVWAPMPVFADSEIKTAVTPVETSLNTLITIRDNDKLPAKEKEEQELVARKEVLKEALTLSIDETNNLLDSLNKLSEFKKDSQESGMRNAFTGMLQSYIAYYEQQLEKADKLATIADIKTLAQEIKTYRETIHNPNVQHIVDFILLSRDESIIEIAKVRFGKIVSDIRKLERNSFIEYGTFDESLNTANAFIIKAESLHKQAKDILFAEPSAITSTATTIKLEQQTIATTSEGNDVIAIDSETPEEISVRDIIMTSFDNIKSAYSIFITISKNARSLLGIE